VVDQNFLEMTDKH